MKYRLIIGEVGNEIGHVVYTSAKTARGAKRTLTCKLNEGDTWGEVQYLRTPAAASMSEQDEWDSMAE